MLQRIRLQVSISVIFTVLIIPALASVIAFSYYENLQNLRAVSEKFINDLRDNAIIASTDLLDPVAATVRVVAQVAGSLPAFFRSEESRNVLYAALTSAPQIDAIYTTFEDGYHRVVTRIDQDRRNSDPQIPAPANWHSSYIDAFATVPRQRDRTFFEHWPEEIANSRYASDTAVDFTKTLPHYDAAAKANDGLAVSDPILNPDTGYPVIAIAYPIRANGTFIGAVSANITLQAVDDIPRSAQSQSEQPHPHRRQVRQYHRPSGARGGPAAPRRQGRAGQAHRSCPSRRSRKRLQSAQRAAPIASPSRPGPRQGICRAVQPVSHELRQAVGGRDRHAHRTIS